MLKARFVGAPFPNTTLAVMTVNYLFTKDTVF